MSSDPFEFVVEPLVGDPLVAGGVLPASPLGGTCGVPEAAVGGARSTGTTPVTVTTVCVTI